MHSTQPRPTSRPESPTSDVTAASVPAKKTSLSVNNAKTTTLAAAANPETSAAATVAPKQVPKLPAPKVTKRQAKKLAEMQQRIDEEVEEDDCAFSDNFERYMNSRAGRNETEKLVFIPRQLGRQQEVKVTISFLPFSLTPIATEIFIFFILLFN